MTNTDDPSYAKRLGEVGTAKRRGASDVSAYEQPRPRTPVAGGSYIELRNTET